MSTVFFWCDLFATQKVIVGQAPRLYNLPSEYMLQGHRYLDPPILDVQRRLRVNRRHPCVLSHPSESLNVFHHVRYDSFRKFFIYGNILPLCGVNMCDVGYFKLVDHRI